MCVRACVYLCSVFLRLEGPREPAEEPPASTTPLGGTDRIWGFRVGQGPRDRKTEGDSNPDLTALTLALSPCAVSNRHWGSTDRGTAEPGASREGAGGAEEGGEPPSRKSRAESERDLRPRIAVGEEGGR